MTSIFAALGLYNTTGTVSNTTVASAAQLKGYSAAWTVPFAGRMYFEKLTCTAGNGYGYAAANKQQKVQKVRAIVNDRVVPLQGCGADGYGMCTLDAFVESQSFSQELGLWNQFC